LVSLAQATNHVISVEYFRFLAPLITSVTKFPERSSAKKWRWFSPYRHPVSYIFNSRNVRNDKWLTFSI